MIVLRKKSLRLRKLSNSINGEWVVIFNVLALLREKPMTYEELMKSGCFKSERHLDFALRRLREGGCIEKIMSAKIYVILGHGITLLSLGLNGHPNFTWRPLPFNVIDTVVPIGEKRHE
jgi:DNA-binding HxlR family transcriptional regulator